MVEGAPPRARTTRPAALRGPLGGIFRRPLLWQLLPAAVVLAAWQWVPSIPGISHTFAFADPFFISSPLRIAKELYNLFTGAHSTPPVWGPLYRTVSTAVVGSALALVVGAGFGLVCSNWNQVNIVVRPYLSLFNAFPKVAMIPIIILVVGSSFLADTVTAFIIVFFLVFFNAYEGGSSVVPEVLDNARILGAGWRDQMLLVRWPFVTAWTFAALPNAIAFGLVGTVTAELFTGGAGIGQILIVAMNTSNADLTFAVAAVLGTVGVIATLTADALRRRLLHWWAKY